MTDRPAIRRWDYFSGAIFLLVSAGAVIRILAVDAVNLWNDEWHLVQFSTQASLTQFLRDTLPLTNNYQPLYYFLTFLYLKLAPLSKFTVRFPALYFGLLSLPLLWWVLRQHFGRKIAAYATVLLAFNFFHIRYSIEARPYALVMLLAILSLHYFLKLAGSRIGPENHSGKRDRLKFFVVNFLIYHTHPLTISMVLVQYFLLTLQRMSKRLRWPPRDLSPIHPPTQETPASGRGGVRRTDPPKLRRQGRSEGGFPFASADSAEGFKVPRAMPAGLHLSSPYLWELLFFVCLPIPWIRIILGRLHLREMYAFLIHPLFGIFDTLFRYSSRSVPWMNWAILALVIYFAWRSWRSRARAEASPPRDGYFHLLLLAEILVIPVVYYLVSLWLYPMFLPRYLSFVLIPLLLVVSFVLDEMKKPFGTLLLLVLVASSAISASDSRRFNRPDPDFDALFERASEMREKIILASYHDSSIIDFYRSVNNCPYTNVISVGDVEFESDYLNCVYVKDRGAMFYAKALVFEREFETRGYFLVPTSPFQKLHGLVGGKIVRRL